MKVFYNDFSDLNELPTEVKELIVTGQTLIDDAIKTMEDRNCNFDLTSKKQLKGDCRKVEKCIKDISNGKVTEKTIKALKNSVVCLRTSYTGLVAFFTR